MPKHPLAEIFGFPPDNLSPEAQRYRKNCLCPYNNKVPSCTKDKANDPLGVCTIYEGDNVAITCPIRFRQDWLIAEDAAEFFFDKNTRWTSLTEIRLNDGNERSAANIDMVLVAYDARGKVIDFGALEVQAVYISGNVRRPFEAYMQDPVNQCKMDWTGQRNYPRPDYLSSSRKRLAPQLLYKGSILKAWGKKQAVAIHQGFYNTLPVLPEIEPESADIAWLIYELQYELTTHRYQLSKSRTVYTQFQPALERLTQPVVGYMNDFVGYLQEKLDEKLEEVNPPDAPSLMDLL